VDGTGSDDLPRPGLSRLRWTRPLHSLFAIFLDSTAKRARKSPRMRPPEWCPA